ncbi:MAG TPA: glutamine synthetase family protein [Acidimicrobiia bacterium]|nr:glutamine synthetase family protein [Acidimicrobiia bacterium]
MAATYDRIRVMFPDHLGLARGKYLPIEHADRGTAHCISLFALGFDREMTPHEGAAVLAGLPDVELSFSTDDVRPGWEPDTGVVVGDVSRHGKPVELSPREVLKRQVAAWQKHGFDPKVGIELEAYLFEPDGEGGWRPISTPGAYVYGTGMSVDPTGTIDAIMSTARSIGLPLESVNSEYDNGQFELTLRHADALRACDDALLFKVMAREVAARNGILLTFMGKPVSDRGGSGLHTNLSFSGGGSENALIDGDSEDGLSDLARKVISGVLHHHVGMTALLAPTVNAYKRLQPGSLCGYWANWGHDHRGVTVRVPADRGQRTRLEHRLTDGATNPHQAVATVLAAARLGYENDYDCPPPETLDCIENASTDVVVPPSLGHALDSLEESKEFVEAFSPAFVDGFLTTKRAEWDRYMRHTTDWELAEYLPFL